MPNPHKNVTAESLPADAAVPASPDASFAGRHGFALKMAQNTVSVFIHDDLAGGDHGKRANRLKHEGHLGHVELSPAGYKWSVHAEPTEDGRVGFAVITEKGKTIAGGEAWLEANGSISFSCQTLYPNVTNAIKLDWKVSGSVDSSGKATVTASVGSSC